MAIPGAKSASIQLQWSGSGTKTLTNAYVASDDIVCDYAKRGTLYPYYSAGTLEAGNTLDFYIEQNPHDSTADPTGLYWSQLGTYTAGAGTYQELTSKFLVTQGTPGSYEPGVPLDFQMMNAARFRIKVKENGVALNYGTCRFWLSKSDIT